MQQWIEDKYWAYLRDENVLKRAAHLVDKECRGDFEDAFLDRQMFSYSRDSIIREIIAALDADRYMPEACVPIAIPKSVYSQRPGAILPYRDRVLLQAIMLCIAPSLDQHLDKSVWSWRVRPDLRGKSPDEVGKRSIFRETELADFPFLKRGTVSRFIDQFEPWYALWPQFDRVTKIALNNKSLKFMVISDISGYFENIQLSLLHSLLSRYEPQAPNTINLLMRHLKAWCGTAQDGSQIERGIPQGNAISSFLGNFFLKPVDDHFRECFDASRVQYFRYVDDIRIVCAEKADATNAALALEAQIRKLKLNLQTAKTHVLSTKDALHRITDKRLDELLD